MPPTAKFPAASHLKLTGTAHSLLAMLGRGVMATISIQGKTLWLFLHLPWMVCGQGGMCVDGVRAGWYVDAWRVCGQGGMYCTSVPPESNISNGI